MGYTHYYENARGQSLDEWTTTKFAVEQIIQLAKSEHGILIGNGAGRKGSKPSVSDLRIQLNGIDDAAHEDFVICRADSFDGFCKTARKPYDLVVTAILCYLSSIGVANVHSDGKGPDFLAGLALAKAALPQASNILDVPMGVMKADVWCSPYVSTSPDGYRVGCAVDERAYIVRERDDAVFCFASHRELGDWLATLKEPGRHPDANRHGPGLFSATGSFDMARHDTIAKAQKKALDAKLKEGKDHPDRQRTPPAYVRLWEMNEPERRPYYFKELPEQSLPAPANDVAIEIEDDEPPMWATF